MFNQNHFVLFFNFLINSLLIINRNKQSLVTPLLPASPQLATERRSNRWSKDQNDTSAGTTYRSNANLNLANSSSSSVQSPSTPKSPVVPVVTLPTPKTPTTQRGPSRWDTPTSTSSTSSNILGLFFSFVYA